MKITVLKMDTVDAQIIARAVTVFYGPQFKQSIYTQFGMVFVSYNYQQVRLTCCFDTYYYVNANTTVLTTYLRMNGSMGILKLLQINGVFHTY